MPCQARIDSPGILDHFILLGIKRQKILQNDGDRDDFGERLENIFTQTVTSCYAWPLISNHVPLVPRMDAVPMDTGMRKLWRVMRVPEICARNFAAMFSKINVNSLHARKKRREIGCNFLKM